MKRRRKPYRPAVSAPWTPAEDAKLAEMMKIGLAVDFWVTGLPSRSLSEMLERRFVLQLPRVKLI